jgi:hypothetical protein
MKERIALEYLPYINIILNLQIIRFENAAPIGDFLVKALFEIYIFPI